MHEKKNDFEEMVTTSIFLLQSINKTDKSSARNVLILLNFNLSNIYEG